MNAANANTPLQQQQMQQQQKKNNKQHPENYEISPYRDDDDLDDDDDDDLDDGENDGPGNARSVKTIPDWARGKNLRDALEAQAHVDPDVIFGARRTTVPLDELFGHPDRLRTGGGTGGSGAAAAAAAARYDESRRGSSGNWADDGATWAEELAYKRAMGYPVPGAGGAPVTGAMGPPPPPLGQQQQQQQQPSFLSRRG